MSGRALALALAPELEELPELVLPDLARAAAVGRLALALARRGDVARDLGGAGRTADESVARLAPGGGELLIVGTGARVRAGAPDPVDSLLVAAHAAGLVARVLRSVDEALALLPARRGIPLARDADPPPFLVVEPDAKLDLAHWTRADDAAGARLLRRGGGAPGPLPAWARTLRLVSARAPKPPARVPPDELLAVADWAAAPEAVEAAARAADPRALRLLGAPRGSGDRRVLRELAVRLRPELCGALDLVGWWREQRLQPLHEMHAGHALAERNASFTENIRP